jgi:DNA-binding IscR family transcriptional regulator
MVQCGVEPGACEHESICPTRINWSRINEQIETALDQVPISEMLVGGAGTELLEIQGTGHNDNSITEQR